MSMLHHPLHPMLVHFPIAFWTSATVCDGTALAGVTQAGGYAAAFLIAGSALALPAVLAGFVDLANLSDTAVRDGTRHMLLMCAAWAAYVSALLLRLDGTTPSPDIPPISLALSVLGFFLMALGGWYGAQLVYHHRAGQRTAKSHPQRPPQ